MANPVERGGPPRSVKVTDLKTEIEALEKMIEQSRRAVHRADELIHLLHARYGLDASVKVEAAD